MIRSIKRLQLRRRGMACSKTRRKHGENELLQKLQTSAVVKVLIFAGFFFGVAGLIHLSRSAGTFRGEDVIAASTIAGLIVIAALLQFFANHPHSFAHSGRTLLVFGAMLLQLSLIPLARFLLAQSEVLGSPHVSLSFFILAMPYALAPMALSVLLGRRQAFFALGFTTLLGCLTVHRTIVFDYLLISLLTGLAAVYTTHELRKRSRLMRAGLYVGLTTLVLALALGHLHLPIGRPDGSWKLLAAQAFTALASGILTASLVGGFLPVLESAFRLTTNISWIELTDLNHPLLKRLTIEAPGTYHHSLVVANLAAAAAERIGANATLCRACSYFHDIGKLVKPGYFIENAVNGYNPHDELTPNMSALVIISHIKEGIDLALKYKLNSQIVDVIQEHHGTTLVYYFYHRALEQQAELRAQSSSGEKEKAEDDIPGVKEEGFRYPGPIPQGRESAIIMLADAVESASRSLKKVTPGKIQQVIDELANARIREKQLDDSDLTLTEIKTIKESFFSTLSSMMHSRIEYPKDGSEDKVARTTKRLHMQKRSPTTSIRVIDAA